MIKTVCSDKFYKIVLITPKSRINELVVLWFALNRSTTDGWGWLFKTKNHYRRIALKIRVRDHLSWLLKKKFSRLEYWEVTKIQNTGTFLYFNEIASEYTERCDVEKCHDR